MTNQKEILIVEDLGIPHKNFENLSKEKQVDYKLIWEKSAANFSKVEIIINVKKTLDQDFLQQFPNLKLIAVAFTGYDSVDLKYCKENNISVYNVPAYSTNAVTELAIGLAIALLREIPKSNEIIRSEKWNLKPGLELFGKTIGILGTGKIGINTARVFKALGCELIGFSRTERQEFKDLGGKYISDKLEFFGKADIISVHLPANEKTKNTVGKEELKAMKKTAFIINTARGAIIDEKALIQSLENNEIAGAGIDVFEKEPISAANKLLKLNNTVLTPHIAYKTEEALQRRAEVTIKNILDFTNHIEENKVN